MGGLNENTKNKMKEELRNLYFIDNQIKTASKWTKTEDLVRIIEMVRLNREKIFELKKQAKDLNKVYEYMNIYNLYSMYNKNCRYGEYSVADASELCNIIYQYYSDVTYYLQDGLIKEKVEKDNEQKEVDTDKEDVFELE